MIAFLMLVLKPASIQQVHPCIAESAPATSVSMQCVIQHAPCVILNHCLFDLLFHSSELQASPQEPMVLLLCTMVLIGRNVSTNKSTHIKRHSHKQRSALISAAHPVRLLSALLLLWSRLPASLCPLLSDTLLRELQSAGEK